MKKFLPKENLKKQKSWNLANRLENRKITGKN
jgi:hypothetical protein